MPFAKFPAREKYFSAPTLQRDKTRAAIRSEDSGVSGIYISVLNCLSFVKINLYSYIEVRR